MINLYSDSIVAYTPVENRECQRNIHLDWICGLLIIHMIGGHIPDFVNVSPKNHLQIMGRYVDVVS